MKYLKTFEQEKENRKYWLLPTDKDRFEISLIQIGCTDINKLLTNISNKDKYVFISYQPEINFWGWQPYNGKLRNDCFELYGFKFQGTVNIAGDNPEIEISSDKYNL